MISSRRVEGLGVGGTHEGGQKQASNEATKHWGWGTGEMHRPQECGPPAAEAIEAASGGRSQSAARVPRNLARRPQSLVELKWPDGAEVDRWSIRVSRVHENIVGFGHDPRRDTQNCGSLGLNPCVAGRARIVGRLVDRLRNNRRRVDRNEHVVIRQRVLVEFWMTRTSSTASAAVRSAGCDVTRVRPWR
jgi:hypothetical protein